MSKKSTATDLDKARLDQMRAAVAEMSKLAERLTYLHQTGPGDTADGQHVLGKLSVFTGNVGTRDQDGDVLVPIGATGCGVIHQLKMHPNEARALALRLLNAVG